MKQSKDLRIPAWSVVTNIIILVGILVMVIWLNGTSKDRIGGLKEDYKNIMIDLLDISMREYAASNVDTFEGTLVGYINAVPNMIVGVYDENYKLIVEVESYRYSGFNHLSYPEFITETSGNQEGSMVVTINDERWELYYRWQVHYHPPTDGITDGYDHRVLLVYGRSAYHFDYSFIQLFGNIILFMVFIIIAKSYMVDNVVLGKILRDIVNLRSDSSYNDGR